MQFYLQSIIVQSNERTNNLQFYVPFNSISVASGQWKGKNERLCAIGLRLRLKKFRLHRGLEPGTV